MVLRYITPTFGGFSFNGQRPWRRQVGRWRQLRPDLRYGLGRPRRRLRQDSRVDGSTALPRSGPGAGRHRFLGMSGGIKESSSGLFLQAAWTQAERLRRNRVQPQCHPTNLHFRVAGRRMSAGLGATTLWVRITRPATALDGHNAPKCLDCLLTLGVGYRPRHHFGATDLFLTLRTATRHGDPGKRDFEWLHASACGSDPVDRSITGGMKIGF